MVEEILNQISGASPLIIYLSLFFFSYIENVFPPSPSDLVVVVGGSLISTGVISFIPTLIITSVGSVLGFLTLYYIGKQLDKKLVRTGKIKWISIEALDKAESWFNKYGYYVILANRFMPGTRSVISFFAGVSELKIKKTILFASISAVAWNAIIIYLGVIFGDNVPLIDSYLSTYSNIVIIATAVIALIFVIRFLFLRKKKK
ncbi:MAG: DedA family protein [Ignavibacteriales bacterium]|nr:MAG: DedA family protein [Ignavibacteriales bacterium]